MLITDTEFSPTIERALAQLAAEAARRSTSSMRWDRAASASATSTTRRSSPTAIRSSRGSIRRTSGTRSRSTTRRAPPAIRRASSTTIAARTSTRCPTSSTGACRGTPCTCGRCRCSTATAGAFRGRWPPTPASTSACARSRRRRSSTRSATHKVTHYCGAPIVHLTLINAPAEMKAGIDHVVHCLVAGAAPPAAVIEGMERMGFDITHVYGLTETYGPAAVCAKHDEWDALDIGARTERNGRQGVRYTVEEGMTVMDPETMSRGAVGRRDDGRDHVPRQHHDEGLPQEPDGDRRGLRRRLVPFRRSRRDAAGRLRQDQGPLEGHHHLRRREHQLARSRGRALPPPGGARGGRRRAARPEVGRDAVRVRRAEARRRRPPRTRSSRTAARTSPASRRRSA